MLSLTTRFILNIVWLDANETKAMVKDIVDKIDARECSYPRDLVVIPLGAHTQS